MLTTEQLKSALRLARRDFKPRILYGPATARPHTLAALFDEAHRALTDWHQRSKIKDYPMERMRDRLEASVESWLYARSMK